MREQYWPRFKRVHHEVFHPCCGDFHGEDLHVVSGGHHKRDVDLDFQNSTVVAKRVQSEVEEEDKAKGRPQQCVYEQQVLYQTAPGTKRAQLKV